MRVLQRLVVTLGHRDDDDLAGLAEVEQRWTYEVADVLDHHDPSLGLQLVESAPHHGGIEVAAGPGVDLDAACTSSADPFGVDRRFLIALDDAQGQAGVDDRTFKQRGLAGAR